MNFEQIEKMAMQALNKPSTKNINKCMDNIINESVYKMLIGNEQDNEYKISIWKEATLKDRKAIKELGKDDEIFKALLPILEARKKRAPKPKQE